MRRGIPPTAAPSTPAATITARIRPAQPACNRSPSAWDSAAAGRA